MGISAVEGIFHFIHPLADVDVLSAADRARAEPVSAWFAQFGGSKDE